MKLSVKWLAGLAVLVLAVVAVVGSTSGTKAATGSIFVVNEWSKVTNESPAPAGRTARGSVYATIDDGAGARIIETNADLIRVVVKDTDLNVTTNQVVTDSANITVTSGGDGDDTVTAGIGQSAVIQLTGLAGTPISGDLAAVQANTVLSVDGGTTNLVGTELAITGFYAGGGANAPWISVVVNVAGSKLLDYIRYQTSAVDSVTVTVKSELEPTGITIAAEETGLSTGVFEGFVRLVPSTATSTPGTAPTLDGTPEPGTAGLIRTTVGPVTVQFDDGGTNRSTSVLVDTSAPTPSITGPVTGTATQNQTPTFSGSVSETGAGLDVSSVMVVYDNRDDATNGTAVVDITATSATFPGTAGTHYVDLAPSTSGYADGDTAFSFSKAPGSAIPAGLSSPDNIVDWVIRASDLAGNIGLSDADASTAGVQLPTVKIDKVLPSFSTTASEHVTGKARSATGEVAARNSLRVAFNDQVTNIQASDFTVTLDSGAVVVPTKVTVVNNPTVPSGFANRGLVYLEFANDLVSNDTPVVALQDTISDLAGNFTSTGSRVVADGIAPSLTVTVTGGSGSDSLTNDKITITITSDEPLSGAPGVAVYKDGAGSAEANPTALAQGANKWTATYAKPGSPVDGKRAVEITVTDTAANNGTVGGNDASASGTPNFTLDTALATPTLTVGGGSTTTDQRRPSIVIDYAAGGEASTVTLAKVTLDGTDITADVVAASDGKRFFFIPSADLALGAHSLKVAAGDASDAAANENATDTTLTVTIADRKTFNIGIFAGWNAVSFPSDPIDPDINSVFDNAGHDAVLGFDPSVPGGWVVSVRDTVSGMLEPATENGLTSVRSTQAYWVHSLNFESVKALLTGEVLPSAGSPPAIVMIPTVAGFNAVPVVDTSRKLTTGNSGVSLTRQVSGGAPVAVTVASYLGAVVEGRVYSYDPGILSFTQVSGSDIVKTGTVLFVEVTGTPTPIFP